MVFSRTAINMLLSTCRKVSMRWIITVTTKQLHRNTGRIKFRERFEYSVTYGVVPNSLQISAQLEICLIKYELFTSPATGAAACSRSLALDASVTRPIQRLRSNKRNSGPLFGVAEPEKTSPWRINNWTQEWRGVFLVWWKLINTVPLCSGRRLTGAYAQVETTFVNCALNENTLWNTNTSARWGSRATSLPFFKTQ